VLLGGGDRGAADGVRLEIAPERAAEIDRRAGEIILYIDVAGFHVHAATEQFLLKGQLGQAHGLPVAIDLLHRQDVVDLVLGERAARAFGKGQMEGAAFPAEKLAVHIGAQHHFAGIRAALLAATDRVAGGFVHVVAAQDDPLLLQLGTQAAPITRHGLPIQPVLEAWRGSRRRRWLRERGGGQKGERKTASQASQFPAPLFFDVSVNAQDRDSRPPGFAWLAGLGR
jgi:hypothetical protein